MPKTRIEKIVLIEGENIWMNRQRLKVIAIKEEVKAAIQGIRIQ